jgi:Mg2+ and Co2+ transporter CorA
MPRTSVRQAPSATPSAAQRGGWSDHESAIATPWAVWLDLSLLNRTGLTQVLERYALPQEMTTYFQLKFQSPKVIAVDRACFLVTCAVVPSPRQLFVPHEIKLCVTPTLVAGLCDRAVRTLPRIGSILSQPTDLPSGGVARFVWELMDGVVTSYETVVVALDHGPATTSEIDPRIWKHRTAALTELIGQQQVFLHNAARVGRKVGVDAQSEECAALDARLERLLRSK